MKFLPLQTFDEITSALNFDTSDCHVVGGCDLYTTKAAGPDKKLYKTIENGLESQYESLLRLSASLSPPHATTAAESLNLARSSPFGSMSEHSSRRTYAYLIATLNASHPDYDFSHLLRPSDFKREKSLKRVINTIDSTLFNLRPNMARDVTLPAPYVMSSSLNNPSQHRQHAGAGTGTRLSPPGTGASPAASVPVTSSSVPHQNAAAGELTAAAPAATAASAPTTSYSWGPRMWKLIDDQMTLNECSIYSYNPEEDPYEGDEGEEDGAIWSLKYFFFNKQRKRVCYLYLKGISVLSGSFHEPRIAQGIPIVGNTGMPTTAARRGGTRQYGYYDSGFDTASEEIREKDEDSAKKKA
ncbi:RNA polymerase III-inhibiting protein maf1, partial [Ascosphaera aggregata]